MNYLNYMRHICIWDVPSAGMSYVCVAYEALISWHAAPRRDLFDGGISEYETWRLKGQELRGIWHHYWPWWMLLLAFWVSAVGSPLWQQPDVDARSGW